MLPMLQKCINLLSTTHLENGVPVRTACLCLDRLPVNHFIDSLWATVDPGMNMIEVLNLLNC